LICFWSCSAVFPADDSFRIFATYNGKENKIIEVDKNNFAPSIAFAWTPNFQGNRFDSILGNGETTVIRGGYGIYYNTWSTQQGTNSSPIVVDTINIDQTGGYSFGGSRIISRVRTIDPFFFTGTLNTTGTIFNLLTNKNNDIAVQSFGQNQNLLGGQRIIRNNPPGTVPTAGCMTKNFVAMLQYSSTQGTLFGLDDHNNGRPISGTPPAFARFTGQDAPICIGCWQNGDDTLNVVFQNYRVQNNRPQVRVSGRQFQFEDKINWKATTSSQIWSQWRSVSTDNAFKFRFNTVTLADGDEDGLADTVFYVGPTSGGGEIFARKIDENSLTATTPPKKVTPTAGDRAFWWALSNMRPGS
jgi:hypothetical protein